jgi:hypothetical protein
LSDENGKWLRGAILGLLSVEELDIDALVVTVSCNKFRYIKNKNWFALFDCEIF